MIHPNKNPQYMARLGIAGVVTVLALMLAVGGFVVAKGAATSAGEAAARVLNRQAVKGCNRNQIQRAYDLLDERLDTTPGPRVASYYIRIVNCGATYAPKNTSGNTVLLPREDQECFVTLVTKHYWTQTEPPTTDPTELRAACRAYG